MATGDTIITLTPLQYAEYTALRAKLAEAERERDYWRKEFRDVVDAGVEAIRAVQEERDRYRAALVEIRDSRDASAKGLSHVARLALAGAAESEKSNADNK